MQKLPEVINEEEYELAKWLVNHGSSCAKWNSWVAWIHVSDRPLITQIYLIRVVSTLQGCGTKLHQWLRLKKYVCERFRHLRWATSPAHMTQVSMKLTLVKAMPIIIALCQNIVGAATFKDAANETRTEHSCWHSWNRTEHSCWHSWNRTEHSCWHSWKRTERSCCAKHSWTKTVHHPVVDYTLLYHRTSRPTFTMNQGRQSKQRWKLQILTHQCSWP